MLSRQYANHVPLASYGFARSPWQAAPLWAATLVLAVAGGFARRLFARRELGFVRVVTYG